MKILIYGLNYHPELTGIGKYTGEMAEWLANEGHNVRVVTAPPYYPKWKTDKNYSSFRYRIEKLNGVIVYRCPLYIPRKPNGLTRILHLLSFSLSSLFIVIYQYTWRPQVVINVIPSIFSSFAALLSATLYNAKTWLHIQDFELDAAFNLGILRSRRFKEIAGYVESLIFKKFDRVSTISPSMLRKLYQKGIDESATLLLPNWVDTNQIFPLTGRNSLRDALGFSQKHIVVLYSGNMGKKQNLEIIIDAARETERKKHIRYVLCGEGPAKSKLISLSSGLTNICFIPLQPQQKLNLLLNLANIHLLPQKPEAADLVMPSKLTGIFSSGKPVIAIADPSTEIGRVVNGRGIIVKPGDIEGFVNAIVELACQPNEREKIGRAGRSYAVDLLNKNYILTQFETTLFDFVSAL
jgi:colanic acid biosynthesis glycosyl transferase WcaI